MTSKNLFFKLLKDNFKRRVPLFTIIALLFLFYSPISMLLTADNYLGRLEGLTAAEIARSKYSVYQSFLNLHQISSGTILFVLWFLSVINAFNAFSYLHDRKSTDFYHSLPVGRGTLFAIANINSVIITAVPYLICSLASALITQTRSGYSGCVMIALTGFINGMGFMLLMYAFAVLAMMLTGNKKVGVLGIFVLHFWIPFAIAMGETLVNRYFDTVCYRPEVVNRLYQYTSPVFWAASYDGGLSEGMRAAIAYIVGLLVLGLGYALYKIRRSEVSERSMAFKKTEFPIKLIITVPASIAVMTMFMDVVGYSDVWSIFFIVAGSLIIHSVIEIIYNLDFKAVLMNKIQYAVCLVLTLAVFAFFRFDISGFDSYLPAKDKIASAGIASYDLQAPYTDDQDVRLEENPYSYNIYTYGDYILDVIDRMEFTDYDTVERIASEGINNAGADFSYDGSSEPYYRTVYIGWHLTNGKTVYRQYYVSFKALSDELEAVYDSGEFKTALYPILSKTDEEVDDFVGVNYADILGYHHVEFNGMTGDELKAAIKKLYDTYTSELMKLTAATRKTEMPLCSIQFKGSHFQEIADRVRNAPDNDMRYYISTLNPVAQYPVYPSFTETLKLLKEYGVDINNSLDADDINAIVISDQGIRYMDTNAEEDYEQKANLIITDKDQIAEILENGVFQLDSYYNDMYPVCTSISTSLLCTDEYYYGRKDVKATDNADASGTAADAAKNSPDDGVPVSAAEILSEVDGPTAEAEFKETETVYIEDLHESMPALPETMPALPEAMSALPEAMSALTYDSRLYADGYPNTLNIYFRYDRIPEFVREYFGITDAMAEKALEDNVW